VLRLQNVYGPGQSPSNPYTGVATFFVNVALDGGAIPVYEDGMIVRDFVFIDDVVAELYNEVVRGGYDFKFVGKDVGSGQKVTILDLASQIASICGAPSPQITGQYRLGDVRSAFSDSDEQVKRVSLDQGLVSLVGWMEASR
jgi:dTDP-L-rhamnose 4-epimerase